MAHHLAELIDKAEKGETEADRLKAQKTATETILKVWEHRAALPGKAYPLAPYKEVIKVLDAMRPDKNPFWHFGPLAEKREQLAADLFGSFSRLVITLLWEKIPVQEINITVDTAAKEALNETEQQVLTALQQWGDLFESEPKSSGQAHQDKDSSTEANFDEIAIKLIDRMTTTLAELRSKLQEVGQQQPG